MPLKNGQFPPRSGTVHNVATPIKLEINQSSPTILQVMIDTYHRLENSSLSLKLEEKYWDGPLNWDKGCCSNIALLLRML